MTASPPTPDDHHILTRSAFAMLFVGTLLTLILLPFVVLAPARPDARWTVGFAGGAFALVLLVLCGLLLAVRPARLDVRVRRLAQLTGRGWVLALLTVALVEVNVLAALVITDVAPTMTLALAILALWSLLIWLAGLLLAHERLTGMLADLRPVLLSIGGTALVALALLLVYVANVAAVDAIGLVDDLRGGLDRRQLTFYGGVEDPAQSSAYWQELSAIRAEWLPYLYWHIDEAEGEYINISSEGIRASVVFAPAGSDVPEVYFFGGSTLWGEGARDDYTIPSQVARLLHEQGRTVRVTNFGQTAYVSTQDMILFQAQLAQGNIPDVAVFYQGFNDIAGALQEGYAGLPHNEVNRAQEFEAGQTWREGGVVLGPPRISLDGLDMGLVTLGETTPERIVQRFTENVRQLRALCDAYSVELVVVWQPAIIYKQALTPQEQAFLDQNRVNLPNFEQVYNDVDALVREAALPEGVIISDLFADEAGDVFFDRVHITEDGNEAVAEAILPAITAALPDATP